MNSNLAIWISGCIVLFLIGLYGLFSKSDGLKVIISIEIMITAVNAIFIGIGFINRDQVDPLLQSFAILSLAIGGVIVGLGLSMLTRIYRINGTVDLNFNNILKW